MTCICAYAPQIGRNVEKKDCFWDKMLSVTGSIVVGGDLNGHVGINVGW